VLKIHAKAALVERREGAEIKRYGHLGTGNYNPSTAGLYEDLGVFTADEAITSDLNDLFNVLTGDVLTGDAEPRPYRRLLVAPDGLRPGILERIHAERDRAQHGERSGIRIKVNGLVDGQIIDALYQASNAGVPVDIVVRATSALRPGVPGLSQNIGVRSMLGRFLAHSRVFHFVGADEYWIGSADMMTRNLDRRVEALLRVTDPRLTAQLDQLLHRMPGDVRSWILGPDGTWNPAPSESGPLAVGGLTAHEHTALGRVLGQLVAHGTPAPPRWQPTRGPRGPPTEGWPPPRVIVVPARSGEVARLLHAAGLDALPDKLVAFAGRTPTPDATPGATTAPAASGPPRPVIVVFEHVLTELTRLQAAGLPIGPDPVLQWWARVLAHEQTHLSGGWTADPAAHDHDAAALAAPLDTLRRAQLTAPLPAPLGPAAASPEQQGQPQLDAGSWDSGARAWSTADRLAMSQAIDELPADSRRTIIGDVARGAATARPEVVLPFTTPTPIDAHGQRIEDLGWYFDQQIAGWTSIAAAARVPGGVESSLTFAGVAYHGPRGPEHVAQRITWTTEIVGTHIVFRDIDVLPHRTVADAGGALAFEPIYHFEVMFAQQHARNAARRSGTVGAAGSGPLQPLPLRPALTLMTRALGRAGFDTLTLHGERVSGMAFGGPITETHHRFVTVRTRLTGTRAPAPDRRDGPLAVTAHGRAAEIAPEHARVVEQVLADAARAGRVRFLSDTERAALDPTGLWPRVGIVTGLTAEVAWRHGQGRDGVAAVDALVTMWVAHRLWWYIDAEAYHRLLGLDALEIEQIGWREYAVRVLGHDPLAASAVLPAPQRLRWLAGWGATGWPVFGRPPGAPHAQLPDRSALSYTSDPARFAADVTAARHRRDRGLPWPGLAFPGEPVLHGYGHARTFASTLDYRPDLDLPHPLDVLYRDLVYRDPYAEPAVERTLHRVGYAEPAVERTLHRVGSWLARAGLTRGGFDGGIWRPYEVPDTWQNQLDTASTPSRTRVQSPWLGDQPPAWDQLATALEVLEAAGAVATATTAERVVISVPDFTTDPRPLLRLAEMLTRYRDELAVMARAGYGRRPGPGWVLTHDADTGPVLVWVLDGALHPGRHRAWILAAAALTGYASATALHPPLDPQPLDRQLLGLHLREPRPATWSGRGIPGPGRPGFTAATTGIRQLIDTIATTTEDKQTLAALWTWGAYPQWWQRAAARWGNTPGPGTGRAGGAARISGAVMSPAGHRTIAAVLAGFTPPRPGRVRTIPARVVGRLWARSGGLPAGFTGLSIVDDLTAAIAARGGPDDVVAYATGGRVYLDTRVLAYTRRGLFSPTELQALIRHELEHLAAPHADEHAIAARAPPPDLRVFTRPQPRLVPGPVPGLGPLAVTAGGQLAEHGVREQTVAMTVIEAARQRGRAWVLDDAERAALDPNRR